MEEKYQAENAYFVHRQQGLFLSVYVDDITCEWKEAKPQSHVEEMDETR